MWLGDGETSNTWTSTQSGKKKKQKLKPLVPAHRPPYAVQSEAKGFTAFCVWGGGIFFCFESWISVEKICLCSYQVLEGYQSGIMLNKTLNLAFLDYPSCINWGCKPMWGLACGSKVLVELTTLFPYYSSSSLRFETEFSLSLEVE